MTAEILRSAMIGILLWLLLPAWIAAGFIDWLCHRKAEIAARCGPAETFMHLLLLGLAGIAILAGLFLEINAPVLAIIFLCYLAHEATAGFDVAYASRHRVITPLEQRTHDFMTAIALSALLLVTLLHWEAFMALVQDPMGALSQPLGFKLNPLPVWTIAAILGGVLVFDLIPYLQELAAGLRARRPGTRVSTQSQRSTHHA